MSTVDVNQKYLYTDEIAAIRNKDWAAGSSIVSEFKELIFANNTLQEEKIKYPPALMKMFDEAIVNVLDQVQRTVNEKNNDMTKNIIVTFKDGTFSIYNDGKSIEIEVHSEATKVLKRGRDIYVPEFIFGVLHQGSNKSSDKSLTTGGINGLGAKICNCFSTEFTVEIQNNKKNYFQKWTNGMRNVEQPVIKKVSTVKQFVKLTFTPDYEHFKYRDFATIEKWIKTRLIHANIFAKYTNKKVNNIIFNDEQIEISSFTDIVTDGLNLQVKDKQFHAVISLKSKVCTANVNGIVVKKGSHMKFIKDAIREKIKSMRGSKKLDDVMLKTYQFGIFINCIIPKPTWGGQRKDELVGYKFDDYQLTDTQLKNITSVIKSAIENKSTTEKIKVNKVEKIDFSKYERATMSGTKESYKCKLLAAEGDSALSHLKTGLTNTVGMKYYGLLSLGGVIINVRKHSTFKNGKYYPTKKILENNFIKMLIEVTGLDFNCEYSTLADIKKLKYGAIVGCVDQDLDGIGQIFGLLINLFAVFWPNLLKHGYVQRFELPVIHAYPKRGGIVEHFYSLPEYERWADTVDTDKYNIKYCKGLGSHNRDEIIYSFKNIDKHTYIYDLSDSEWFEACYGLASDKRKQYLGDALLPKPIELLEEQQKSKKIMTDDHLLYETRAFQKDNIGRHLISAIDGFNESGRMIFDGALKAFSNKNKWLKTAQFAAFVAEHENYHHGEGSLETSIGLKAFLTTGGVQLPLLLPNGNFGNRDAGTKGIASARYTYVKLNKKLTALLFPQSDYHLLEFNFDEGKRSEPKCFVPIIPTAILEHIESPATGWKIKVWARNVLDVIANVRSKILNKDFEFLPMSDFTRGWRGSIVYDNGNRYCYGSYRIDDKFHYVYIDELPLKVWVDDYRNSISAKNEKEEFTIIASEENQSKNDQLKIVYELYKGAASKILTNYRNGDEDPFVNFFNLRVRMDDHLNMMGSKLEVIEFNRYEDIIEYWFPFRQDLYERRIERQKIILEMKIKYYENLIRFCNDNYDLTKKSIDEIESYLTSAKYAKFNHTKLMNPEFMTNDELRQLMNVKATYDYLMNLNIRERSKNYVDKYNSTLDSLRKELDELSVDDIVSKTWLHELDELQKVIEKGFATDWQFDDYGKFKM